MIFLLCVIENVEVLANCTINIEERNGKVYAVPSDISVVWNDFQQFKMEFDYQYIPSATAKLIDGMVASHWKMIKPLMDPTVNTMVGDTMKLVIVPMIQAAPLQDVFDMESSGEGQC